VINPAQGVAFTEASDGDMRSDAEAVRRVSSRLGVASDWARVAQQHGREVVAVGAPGHHGPADGMATHLPGLPLAVLTADCLGVVIRGTAGVAVAHAGWRGLAAGILERTVDLLQRLGGDPYEAWVGPHIGPCCFEVGPEVADLFPDHTAVVSDRTTVDLLGVARTQLGLPLRAVGSCTRCGEDAFSHRATGTRRRMAAIGWWTEEG
jgi:YfiH family protein